MNDISYNGPKRDDLLVPLIKALRELGGSGRIDEINKKIIDILSLPDEIVNFPHTDGSQTKIEYELAWARTNLKNIDILENTEIGLWVLKNSDKNSELDKDTLIKMMKFHKIDQKELKKKKEIPLNVIKFLKRKMNIF